MGCFSCSSSSTVTAAFNTLILMEFGKLISEREGSLFILDIVVQKSRRPFAGVSVNEIDTHDRFALKTL